MHYSSSTSRLQHYHPINHARESLGVRSDTSKARNVPVGSHVLNEASNRVAFGGLCLLHEAFDLESAQSMETSTRTHNTGTLLRPGTDFSRGIHFGIANVSDRVMYSLLRGSQLRE